jgi:hypothetical protein
MSTSTEQTAAVLVYLAWSLVIILAAIVACQIVFLLCWFIKRSCKRAISQREETDAATEMIPKETSQREETEATTEMITKEEPNKRTVSQGKETSDATTETIPEKMPKPIHEAANIKEKDKSSDSLSSQSLWWDSDTEDPLDDLEDRSSDIYIGDTPIKDTDAQPYSSAEPEDTLGHLHLRQKSVKYLQTAF